MKGLIRKLNVQYFIEFTALIVLLYGCAYNYQNLSKAPTALPFREDGKILIFGKVKINLDNYKGVSRLIQSGLKVILKGDELEKEYVTYTDENGFFYVANADRDQYDVDAIYTPEGASITDIKKNSGFRIRFSLENDYLNLGEKTFIFTDEGSSVSLNFGGDLKNYLVENYDVANWAHQLGIIGDFFVQKFKVFEYSHIENLDNEENVWDYLEANVDSFSVNSLKRGRKYSFYTEISNINKIYQKTNSISVKIFSDSGETLASFNISDKSLKPGWYTRWYKNFVIPDDQNIKKIKIKIYINNQLSNSFEYSVEES